MSTMNHSFRYGLLRPIFLDFMFVIQLISVAQSATVCNTQEHGRFKCECSEISNGHMRVDCSNNDFLTVPLEGFPDGTSQLILKNNRINGLRTNDFLTAPSLLDLALDHNEIALIQPNAFRGLASLRVLELNHNFLTRIESSAFTELANLTHIDLRQNEITSIASDAFYFMPYLNTVDLQGVRLQCDCETLALRKWANEAGVKISGAKCSNFINSRNLEDIPYDQFGDCSNPPQQTCVLCNKASSLTECVSGGELRWCGSEQDSCNVVIDVTAGQQSVSAQCRSSADCVNSIYDNPELCREGHWDQRCSFCCTGRSCNENIKLNGYTYQVSTVISFTLNRTFDPVTSHPGIHEYRQLIITITKDLTRILEQLNEYGLQLEHIRSTSANLSLVTMYATATWSMATSNAQIQEQLFQTLDTAVRDKVLDIDIIGQSLMVYTLGYCKEEIIETEEGFFKWPNTGSRKNSTLPCPHPSVAGGKATRICDSVWHETDHVLMATWSPPDLSGCSAPSDVTRNLKELQNKRVTDNNVGEIVQTLRKLTESELTATDLGYVSSTLETVMNADITMDLVTGRDVIVTYDNMLNVDSRTLRHSQQRFNSIERALLALERFSGVLQDRSGDVITTGRISVGIIKRDQVQSGESNGFHVNTLTDSFEPGQVTFGSNATQDKSVIQSSSIFLPPSVLQADHNELNDVQFVAFSDDTFFKAMGRDADAGRRSASTAATSTGGPSFKTVINSVILAASLGTSHVTHLTEPVTLTFKHKSQGVSPKCVYWDFTANKHEGAWSDRGCLTKHMDNEYTVCECDHLTNFALIMDVYGEGSNINEGHKQALNVISYVGCAISLAALIVTLITYSVSRKLHKDNPSKLLMNLCMALSCVMIFFIVVTQPSVWRNKLACQATAGILHYFLLSVWMWMAVEAFYMYLALIKIFKTYISRFMLKSCVIGWGVPAVIVIITVAINTDHYGKQGDICWLSSLPFYWSCLAPIVMILVINFVVFGMVMHQLRKLNARNDKRAVKHLSIKTQLRGSVAVVILLGLTWVFAIFAVGKASLAFQYLFCIFNAFQGLFIFIFYCVLKREVKDIWREKWSEFTSTGSSNDRTEGRGEPFLSKSIVTTPHTTTTDSPRSSTMKRPAENLNLEHLNGGKSKKTVDKSTTLEDRYG